jgi:pantothenate kinase
MQRHPCSTFKQLLEFTPLLNAGFHYYRSDLDSWHDAAHAHARRGAAFTFNAQAFVDSVRAIQNARCSPDEAPLMMPSFDHYTGDPVPHSIYVQPWHKLVIFEGLYLTRGAIGNMEAVGTEAVQNVIVVQCRCAPC